MESSGGGPVPETSNNNTSHANNNHGDVKLRKKSRDASHRGLVTQSQIYPSTTTDNDDENADANKGLRRKSSTGGAAGLRSSGENNNNNTMRTTNSGRCSSTFSNGGRLSGVELVKMSGYLEKRSKMIGWKRFWFVLDGHLLTYFKSKADYDSLSACCGSINLGIASTVRPLQIRGCKGFPLQITTRSQIYYLRSLEKPILEKWLLALQETTCTPPKISSPTWTDPGVQFYRYSFASGSTWSLGVSSDDISGSLSNLPKNFYLPSSLGKQHNYNSNFLGTSTSPIKKCQSLASLLPSTSSSGTIPMASDKMSSILPHARRIKEESKGGSGRVRQSASMLVLESSTPAAIELRKELSAKLSAGNLFKTKLHGKKDHSPVGDTISEENLSKVEKSADSQSPHHHYDEIIDFEANYTSTRSSSSRTSSTTSNLPTSNNSIDYEPVLVSSAGNPWEKRIEYQPPQQEQQQSNRNSLISISEVPETQLKSMDISTGSTSRIIHHQSEDDYSRKNSTNSLSSSSGSFKKKKGIGGFFQKILKKGSDKKNKNGTGFGGSNKDLSSGVGEGMIITGPVDLKSMMGAGNYGGSNSSINKTPQQPQQQLKVEPPKKHKSKNKNQKLSAPSNNSTATGTTSSNVSNISGAQNVFSNETVLAELKTKVGQLKRTNTEPLSENKQQSQQHELNRRSTVPEHVHPAPGVQLRANNNEYAPGKPEDNTERKCPRIPSQEEYQDKLAKFNRLSAHLNPTFIAALNKSAAAASAANSSTAAIGRSNSLSTKTRADEPPRLPPKKKQKPTTFNETGSSTTPAYDVPQNNQPVLVKSNSSTLPKSMFSRETGPDFSSLVNLSPFYSLEKTKKRDHAEVDLDKPDGVRVRAEVETKLPLLRELTKKNSAPDVIFAHSRKSSSTDSPELSILPNILHGTSNLEKSPPPPPPRPPKLNLETYPNCNCPILLTENLEPNISSPVSTKSIDNIDNLDALSDVSSALPTPPNTPYQTYPPRAGGATSSEQYARNMNSKLLEVLPSLLSTSKNTTHGNYLYSDGDLNPYENLQLKYATINTLVTELETVEETEDEIIELYDDFPMLELINPFPPQKQNARLVVVEDVDEEGDDENEDVFDENPNFGRKNGGGPDSTSIIPSSTNTSRAQSIRHSGIDELQKYLYSSATVAEEMEDKMVESNNYLEAASHMSSTGAGAGAPALNPGVKKTGKINRLGHSAAVEQLHKLIHNNNTNSSN